MVVALSRFGTFSGLSTVHSGNNSASLSEHATWSSARHVHQQVPDVLAVEMETTSRQRRPGLHHPADAHLGPAGPADQVRRAAVRPLGDNGAIPFIDFGNKYMISGASYSPQVLQGKSWSEIATA